MTRTIRFKDFNEFNRFLTDAAGCGFAITASCAGYEESVDAKSIFALVQFGLGRKIHVTYTGHDERFESTLDLLSA